MNSEGENLGKSLTLLILHTSWFQEYTKIFPGDSLLSSDTFLLSLLSLDSSFGVVSSGLVSLVACSGFPDKGESDLAD